MHWGETRRVVINTFIKPLPGLHICGLRDQVQWPRDEVRTFDCVRVDDSEGRVQGDSATRFFGVEVFRVLRRHAFFREVAVVEVEVLRIQFDQFGENLVFSLSVSQKVSE